MVGECSGGPQEGRKVASMRGLYQSQRRMSKGQFSITTDRSDSRCNIRTWNAILSGCFLRISPNPYGTRRWRKTTFITPHGLYCYKVMPFGLKNARATYQRLMTKNFKPLIGNIVEVYIDDVVFKSKTRSKHARHLQEVFHLLRQWHET